MNAVPARERILAHLAAEAKPELSEIRIVHALADVEGEPMPAVVPAFSARCLRGRERPLGAIAEAALGRGNE
jgi:hypothetical protein